MITKSRNPFIDILKGVAVFLMLWGHCIQYCVAGSQIDFFENNVFQFIYSFHMPLFMLVSGYLFFFSFSKRGLKELLVHRVQSFVQPIVFCSFFNYLVTTVLFAAMRGKFGAAFNGDWLSNLSSLWFLWSVLAASIATAVVCKKAKRLPVQILLLAAMIPLIALFPNMNENIYMYPYFVLGFYFAQYKDKLPSLLLKMKYISLPLFPILLCFYDKKHYIYTTGLLPGSDYSLSQMLLIDAYRWLIGLVGSVFVITILQLLYQYVTVKLKNPLLSIGLSAIGRKSLQIYALSVPFLSVYLANFFPKALSLLHIENIFVRNIFVYNFVFTALLSVEYAVILYFIVKLLEKFKIANVMFGK